MENKVEQKTDATPNITDVYGTFMAEVQVAYEDKETFLEAYEIAFKTVQLAKMFDDELGSRSSEHNLWE